jgi:signal transduction histidine kinase/PAS domain-containing protein
MVWIPLAALAALHAAVPFLLLRARHAVGLTPLAVYAGGSVALAIFVRVAFQATLVPGISASIADLAVWPSLLAVGLALYVVSGAAEARRYILSLAGLSLVLALSTPFLSLMARTAEADIAPETGLDARSMVALMSAVRHGSYVHAVFLAIAPLFIPIVYQWLSNHTAIPAAGRAIAALAAALLGNTLLQAAFSGGEGRAGLAGHLAATAVAAAVSGLLVAVYLRFFESGSVAPGPRPVLDILTAREEAERARRRADAVETRYGRLFECMLDAVVVISGGRILDLNRRAEQTFGMERTELLRSSASVLGLPEVKRDFEIATVALRTGRSLRVEAAAVDIELAGVEARMIILRDVTERERAIDLVRRKNRELAALNSLVEAGLRGAEGAGFLDEATRQVHALLGGDSCVINLRSTAGDWLETVAGTGLSEESRRNSAKISSGLVWSVYGRGKPLLDNDVDANPSANRQLQTSEERVRATVIAPIIGPERPIGTVSVCSYGAKRFDADDQALLSTIGSQLGAVIASARLMSELKEQQESNEILLSAATAFGQVRGFDDLFEAIFDAVRWCSRMDVVSLLRYDSERDVLTLTDVSGMPPEAVAVMKSRQWGPANPAVRRLQVERKTIVLDAETMRALDPEAWAFLKPPCMAMIPMFHQGTLMGAVTVNFPSMADVPDGRTIAILEGIAGLAAAAHATQSHWSLSDRRARGAASLLEVGRELATSRVPEELLQKAAERVRNLLAADGATVFVLSEGKFRAEAEAGMLATLGSGPLEENAVFGSRAPAAGEAVAVEDVAAAGAESALAERMGRQGARSMLLVPIRLGDRLLGALQIADARPRRHAPDERTSISTLSTYVGVCLENVRLLQDLRISLDELREAQQQVVHAESLAAIGRLSASIAHEIRNPLAGISASAQALLRSPTGGDPANAPLLRIIDRESKRLNRIITDFLQFARPRPPSLRRVAVPALVDSTLSLMEAEAGTRIVLRREFAPDLPGIQADGDQIKQVLLNLLTNAFQAMPEGGTVEVRVAPSDLPSGSAVELSVSDTGPGIPPGDLARVFEPFFSTRKDGTGLGLAIAHQIVHAHGGSISAHSVAGKGALFRIVLPTASTPVFTRGRG